MSANAPTMAMNGTPAGKGSAEPPSSVVTPGGGAMMSANPSMAMSANAPTMAMNGTAAGKKDAEPQSSVETGGGGATMSANAPTMAMNANSAAMMKAAPAAAAAENLPVEGSLPSLSGAVEWLNSPPLTAKSLKGRVVLVDFSTCSCIDVCAQFPTSEPGRKNTKTRASW